MDQNVQRKDSGYHWEEERGEWQDRGNGLKSMQYYIYIKNELQEYVVQHRE